MHVSLNSLFKRRWFLFFVICHLSYLCLRNGSNIYTSVLKYLEGRRLYEELRIYILNSDGQFPPPWAYEGFEIQIWLWGWGGGGGGEEQDEMINSQQRRCVPNADVGTNKAIRDNLASYGELAKTQWSDTTESRNRDEIDTPPFAAGWNEAQGG